MKRMRKWVLVMVLAILTAGISGTVYAAPKLSAKTLTLSKGEKKKLTVKGTKAAVKWSSSKKKVATVAKDGTVTAKKKGTAVITAKTKTARFTCKVTVEQPRLNASKLTLNKGGKYTLKLTGTKRKSIKWSTSSKATATVKKGVVNAKKAGTAVITAKLGAARFTCKVTVEDPWLSETAASAEEGSTLQLSLYGTSLPVSWASGDTGIAEVDEDGLVTAKKPGSVEITAKTENGQFACRLTVTKKEIPLTEVILSETSLTLDTEESATLKAEYLPTDTTDDVTITWTSSNETVATVSNDGKVTGVAEGTAIIRAAIGDHSASCKVTVLPTAKDYFLKLIQTVQRSSRVNSSGEHFLRTDDTYKDTEYRYGIVYDESRQILKFSMFAEDPDDKDMLLMEIGLANVESDQTEAEFLHIYIDHGSFTTKATLRMSAYDGETDIYFRLLETTSSAWTTSNVQSLSNAALHLAFLTWNHMIQDYAGFSFKNIGFTNLSY